MLLKGEGGKKGEGFWRQPSSPFLLIYKDPGPMNFQYFGKFIFGVKSWQIHKLSLS